MIKVNVVLNNISWKKYLKNPNKFVAKKINLLNKNNKNYKKNIFIVSILLSGAKEIKKLNKKFRNKNKSTDILSFPFYSKSILKKKIKQKKEIYLGDIIINLGKIKNKNDLKKFKNEFNKLWVHGLVHLFGYKHKKDQEFNKMNNIEKQYLRLIN